MEKTSQDKLALVAPVLAERVAKLLALAEAQGFELRVLQGLRTFAEQDALYSQGRTRKGPKVTNAKGGESNHNYGVAVDLGFIVNGEISWDDVLYRHIGGWASAVDLNWGGHWHHFVDLPHVELPDLPKWQVLLPIYRQGGLSAVWNSLGMPAPTKPRDIKQGDTGEDVRVLQAALHLTVDGVFGPATDKAVREFQGLHSLRADGIVGTATRKALGI